MQSALIIIFALTLIAILNGGGHRHQIIRNLMKQLGGEPDYAVTCKAVKTTKVLPEKAKPQIQSKDGERAEF